MKRPGPITTLRYLTFLSVNGEKLQRLSPEDALQSSAALCVRWYEHDGKKEISKSERWVRRSADIWQAM